MDLLWAVARAWKNQGRGSGEQKVWNRLGKTVPLREVRRHLRDLKARWRKVLARRLARDRVSMQVLARDAVWSMDATHLGRDRIGEVQGEVVKDCASTTLMSVSVGRPSDGDAVVAILNRVLAERGVLPLVLVTDNGPPYCSEVLEEWLDTRGVVHLFSLPHTPQHNASAERANGEIKEDTGLGKGVLLEALSCPRWTLVDAGPSTRGSNVEQGVESGQAGESAVRSTLGIALGWLPSWCRRLARAVLRMNACRVRSSRGHKTAAQLDGSLPRAEHLISRESFLRAVRKNVELAVLDTHNSRARRRAQREAILRTLELYGLVRRTRGGEPWTGPKAESQP
jgi:transposase InsO family protein